MKRATREGGGIFRKTLNLPKTDFPIRPNPVQREPALLPLCVSKLYQWQAEARSGPEHPAFVIHDGPPFANGSLHSGHFLNKVLKDIINRYKLLRGYRIDFVPGWDCHGLPIELKALEKLKAIKSKEKKAFRASDLSPQEVRRVASEFAREAIEDQRKDFERWGILADWKDDKASRYLTMDPEYEAAQLEVFLAMVEKGYIYRGRKPVYWSPSSQTALAESELEYQQHISQACYVSFPLRRWGARAKTAGLDQFKNVAAVAWTTTPWSIPGNQAMCLRPETEYSLVEVKIDGVQCQYFILASALVESFLGGLGMSSDATAPRILRTFYSEDLVGSDASHPLFDRPSPFILGSHVTMDAGTGIVHTAPAHGQEDYEVWKLHGHDASELSCPVDDRGKFTSEAGEELQGLDVLGDGTEAVLDLLKRTGRLIKVEPLDHRYPYDWRTKKPVIVRATDQWFARLDDLHEDAKKALEKVEIAQTNSRNRLLGFLGTRTEWCISRQRSWGVPIPVFYDKRSGEPLLTSDSVHHVMQLIKEKGANCWWELATEELLAPPYRARATDAEGGQSQECLSAYVKGRDTLDVWFDSGSSWHAVLMRRGLKFPADIYLEGSDQHRGWFQSSLLTSVAKSGQAPFKELMTHGFVLDEKVANPDAFSSVRDYNSRMALNVEVPNLEEAKPQIYLLLIRTQTQGRKMSKSLGNVLSPDQIINGTTGKKQKGAFQYPPSGADLLRYWVASTDFTRDVNIGASILDKVADQSRKIRNTARFLMGNLSDFEVAKAVAPHDMLEMDRYMLHVIAAYHQEITDSYERHNFNKVYQLVCRFVSTDLSSFYLEATKDRLYCDQGDGVNRASGQTVMLAALRCVSMWIAPIACFTAEDIHQHSLRHFVGESNEEQFSIFQSQWPDLPSSWSDEKLNEKWEALRRLRTEVNKVIEEARGQGFIGSALECQVVLRLDNETITRVLEGVGEDTLSDLFLVSQSQVVFTAASEKQDLAQREKQCADDRTFRFSSRCSFKLSETDPAVELVVEVLPAAGLKCSRCWKYSPTLHSVHGGEVCLRCSNALSALPDLGELIG